MNDTHKKATMKAHSGSFRVFNLLFLSLIFAHLGLVMKDDTTFKGYACLPRDVKSDAEFTENASTGVPRLGDAGHFINGPNKMHLFAVETHRCVKQQKHTDVSKCKHL